MKALKFLKPGGIGPYSGFEWPLPNGKPGEWVITKDELVECHRGIHACTLDQAIAWMQPDCYVIELGGKVIVGDDKILARKGRLLYKTPLNDLGLRLFAADCGEHVLPLFEAKRPNDDRPRKAIEAARAYASGQISAAAGNAAQAAARAAAGDAAGNAAQAAARAAAGNAAQAAAQAAARAAAWAAAGAAARVAAGAGARVAAGAAARAAAGDAAGAAAWAAERGWQIRRFRHYLKLPKGWDA